jgi:DNA polymerase gamma 1
MQNPLGYNILSPKMFKKIFGANVVPKVFDKSQINKIQNEMQGFNIKFPIKNGESSEVPDFNAPSLEGDTIADHFKHISSELCSDLLQRVEKFIQASTSFPVDMLKLDFAPQNFKPFWNKIDFNGKVSSVDEPCEDIFIFDCETFVKGSSFGHPIMGTVLSSEAYYVWLHPCLMDLSLKYEPQMINIGSNKVVIAHNAAFDHARVSESYSLTDSNVWLDTMSMHINVSGLASGQRFWFAQDTSDGEAPKFSPKWSKYGSLNNLVDCYNFHCMPLSNISKKIKQDRDLFVVAESLSEIYADFANLTKYALNDTYYTAQLFYNLFPKYHQANPSLTTLVGHSTLMKSFLPLHDDWDNWFQRCEAMWESFLEKQTLLLSELTHELLDAFKNDELDVENDPWLSQLDWEVNSKLTKTGKPSSKWYGYPQWVRDVAKIGTNGQLVINKITTKQRISHLLLRLRWNGEPVKFSKSSGWCFYNKDTQRLEQIPHPKQQDANVGNLITKDYLAEFESGVISSDLPQAQELLNLAIAIAYWTSVRSRVERVTYDESQGFKAHVPEVVPHNTSTNRAGCDLWFTVPGVKKTKIGSEIKTMCRAPEGWKFVQADYDKK